MRTPSRGMSAALAVLVGLVPLSLAGSAAPASAADTDIRINEIITNSPTHADAIELTNIGDAPVDVSGWVVKDNNDTRTFAIPGGTTVAPDAYVTITVDDGTATGFGLGNGDAARIYLPDGTTLVDGHTFPSHSAPSWSRCPDGTGDFVQANSETLGAANDCPTVDDLVINEVESNGDATNGDWIELGNPTSVPLDASGLVVKDSDDTRTLTVPAGTTVPAGGFAAVVTENAAGTAPEGRFGLGSNDKARLFHADGTTLIAEYAWTAHATTTYGRCPDLAGDLVATGAGTFGTANSCPLPAEIDTIKLNEVESNGDTVGDWVEITNTGDVPVNVSGWKVRDAAEDHPFAVIPDNTVVQPGGFFWLYTEFPPPGFGLGVDDSVTLFQADGSSVVDSYAWSGGHAATTYGRCADGTGEWQVTTVATKGSANACSPVRVNEVESSDAAAGPDWVELVNLSGTPIDVAGWVLKDSGDAEPTTLAAPSIVPANGHLVVDTLAAGLGSSDAVRLFDPSAKLIDSFAWTAHATQTYGRCKDGVGAFVDNVAPTPGAVNDCPGLDTEAWPGSQTVATADLAETFNQDASGLAFDPADPGTLWVAQNKAGTLTKLVKDGATWVPAEGWSPGRNPRYADGTGAPDTEGITFGPDGAVYLASERNNEVSGVSRNTVLRYEPGTSMNATDEWALNGVLPAVGANLGLEGITWIPDTDLVAGGLVDQSTAEAYDPADYPAHGTGLHVVAVEGTGLLYVLALDQTAAVQETAHLVATIDPQLRTNAGPAGVMDVVWDPELERLWAVCDDSCDGVTVNLALAAGEWDVVAAYDRPVGMPNLNNEGFGLAPQSTCVDGRKAVLWSDDGDTDGHSLRTGTFPCTEVPEPTPVANDVAPRITGTAKVGFTLTGSAGTWTPTPATTTLQWLANNAPITGATGTRLKVGPGLVGKRISLRVTVTADGHVDGVATSAQTAPVARGLFVVAQGPRIVGTPKAGRPLSVRAGILTPAPTKVTYAWYVNGKRVSTAARLPLLRRWAGDRVVAWVTYSRASYTTTVRSTAAVRVRR